jgi:Crinkler effector protein N-terminal domain
MSNDTILTNVSSCALGLVVGEDLLQLCFGWHEAPRRYICFILEVTVTHRTSSSMTDNPAVPLLCLLEGDDSVFKVNPHIHQQVTKLKELVHEKRKTTLKCDAADLVLFEVHHLVEKVKVAAYFTML